MGRSVFSYTVLKREEELVMIRLDYFTRNDFSQLLDWVPTESFMIQWAGTGFTFPLHIHQKERMGDRMK